MVLCGVFGNIPTADIRATIAAVPAMLATGGTMIWTRGWFPHEDLRPSIRLWVTQAGLTEIAFDGEPERDGVGVARLQAEAPQSDSDTQRLFHFIR